jgi:Lipopolysaccharide-assembly, LptC-related
MSWFRKALTVVAAVAIGASAFAAEDEPAKPVKSKDAAGKKDKKAPADDPAQKSKMTVPLPVGHDAKKLTIPYRDGDGKLQMRFVMELGKRVDADHLAMTKLQIQTFDDTEAEEMSIVLPDSVLDLNTRVITTKSGVTVKRDDFVISGKTLEFNTETKQGRLGGRVQMKIFNLENETNPQPEAKAGAK